MGKLLHLFLVGIFAFDILTTSDSIVIGEVLDIISVGKDVIVGLAKAWNIVDDHFDLTETPMPFVRKTERKLFRKLDRIKSKLDTLNSEIETVGTRTISTFMNELPDKMKLELRLNDLLDYMTRLNVFYQHMNYYVNDSDIERVTLEDFAKTVVSHSSGSVRSLLERIHAFISSNGNGLTDTSILRPISKTFQV